MNSVYTRVQMNYPSNRYSHWPAAGGGVEIGFTLQLLCDGKHESQLITNKYCPREDAYNLGQLKKLQLQVPIPLQA
jgi:hypothetical protein